MEYTLVCLTALAASTLTLFSGFGLGTILMPAFALLFPVEVAVALTALVHFANNLLKLGLFWRQASPAVVLRFGLPAMAASLAGAWLLLALSDMPALFTYQVLDKTLAVSPVKLTLAGLMAFFALAELRGSIKNRPAGRGNMVLGGLVSGFFGGLSGNQGAFRSAFLLRAGLDKEAFIATGVVLACLVDSSRLAVYAGHLARPEIAAQAGLLVAATASAFAGVFAGRRLLKKVTLTVVRSAVAAMMLLIAAGLAAGLI